MPISPRFGTDGRARTAAVPAGPMADVAFLLLVFFLVATTIQSDEVGLRVTLPPVRPPGVQVVEAGGRLEVLVGADGALLVGGVEATTADVRRRVGAFARPGHVVVLRADRRAAYGAYVSTLDAVLLGFRDVGVPPRLALPHPPRPE